MKYSKNLQLQKRRLALASGYAEQILKCDANIEVGKHVEYFKTVRDEAIQNYADEVAEIVESSIDIAIEFSEKAKPFQDMFLEQINVITKDYADSHGINIIS